MHLSFKSLKDCRKAARVSQISLSKVMGFSQSYISEIETGRKLVSFAMAKHLLWGVLKCVENWGRMLNVPAIEEDERTDEVGRIFGLWLFENSTLHEVLEWLGLVDREVGIYGKCPNCGELQRFDYAFSVDVKSLPFMKPRSPSIPFSVKLVAQCRSCFRKPLKAASHYYCEGVGDGEMKAMIVVRPPTGVTRATKFLGT